MHPIKVHSRHTPAHKLEKKYPGHAIVDVTSRADEPWVRFSPFYPLGEIPVAGSPGVFSQSVEGVWQGLKVFVGREGEGVGVDTTRFDVTSMKGLKRTVRRFGPVLGHRFGLGSDDLLSYIDARWQIYLPTYLFALEQRLTEEVAELRALAELTPVVLLDYETNGDLANLKKPLSHAWLLAHYLQGAWPER